jgi:hypothetical protein
MPTMSDSRRKKIQARQRKAENAIKRTAKLAKKERNGQKKKAGARKGRTCSGRSPHVAAGLLEANRPAQTRD